MTTNAAVGSRERAFDAAARNLVKLRSRVDAVAVGERAKLIVGTAVGGYG